MNNKYLALVRGTLLLLVVLFFIIFVYRYLSKGNIDYLLLTPVIGLLFFYFITRPNAE